MDIVVQVGRKPVAVGSLKGGDTFLMGKDFFMVMTWTGEHDHGLRTRAVRVTDGTFALLDVGTPVRPIRGVFTVEE